MKSIKKFILIALALFLSTNLFSQVKVSTENSNGQVNGSAALEVESSDKGLLLPRLTTTQRNAIQSPSVGLVVYDITTNQFMYYNGSSWVSSSSGGGGTGVPYTGATANVDLGTNSLTAASLTSTGDITVNGLKFGKGPGSNNALNLALGDGALFSNTSGNNNIAIGYQGLFENITGINNTAIGINSLAFNQNGNQNTALGSGALYYNTEGAFNVSTGNRALFFNQIGYSNTANGFDALYNSTGGNNTALGYYAGRNLTAGNNNIAIGSSTNFPSTTASYQLNIGNTIYGLHVSELNSSPLIGIGTSSPTATLEVNGTAKISNTPTITTATKALVKDPTTGQISEQDLPILPSINNLVPYTGASANINLGTHTLTADTLISNKDIMVNGLRIGKSKSINSNNIVFGDQALNSITNGQANVAIGFQSLKNTTGYPTPGTILASFNVGIGPNALVTNTTGKYNLGIGSDALYSNSTGNENVAVGNTALFYSTGSNNVGIGQISGLNLTSGDGNIAIGYNTNFASATGSNQLVIGNVIYGQSINGSLGKIAIGSTTFTGSNRLTVDGSIAATAFNSSSDRRFKKDIQSINLGLKEILQLKPSSYYWNTKNERMTNADPTKLQYGFIAQELEAVIPAVVSSDGSEKDYKSVNYEALIPVLTKAIQEQQLMIDALNKRIEILEKGKSEE